MATKLSCIKHLELIVGLRTIDYNAKMMMMMTEWEEHMPSFNIKFGLH
jgi:hypothetical protein